MAPPIMAYGPILLAAAMLGVTHGKYPVDNIEWQSAWPKVFVLFVLKMFPFLS